MKLFRVALACTLFALFAGQAMGQGYQITNVKSYGKHTETAGTVITEVVPPKPLQYARVQYLTYTPNGTNHTLTALKPYSRTTLSAAASASQTVVKLTANPGTGTTPGAIAANDWCVLQLDDGTYQLLKVSSVDSLNITMTANLNAAAASGNILWFYGAEGDSHPQFALTDGAARNVGDYQSFGFAGTDKVGEPLVIHVNNASNAGTLNNMQAIYTISGGP